MSNHHFQAPASMKSVVQAAWLLTVAFGNLIVIFVAEVKSEALSKVRFRINERAPKCGS